MGSLFYKGIVLFGGGGGGGGGGSTLGVHFFRKPHASNRVSPSYLHRAPTLPEGPLSPTWRFRGKYDHNYHCTYISPLTKQVTSRLILGVMSTHELQVKVAALQDCLQL